MQQSNKEHSSGSIILVCISKYIHNSASYSHVTTTLKIYLSKSDIKTLFLDQFLIPSYI